MSECGFKVNLTPICSYSGNGIKAAQLAAIGALDSKGASSEVVYLSLFSVFIPIHEII